MMTVPNPFVHNEKPTPPTSPIIATTAQPSTNHPAHYLNQYVVKSNEATVQVRIGGTNIREGNSSMPRARGSLKRLSDPKQPIYRGIGRGTAQRAFRTAPRNVGSGLEISPEMSRDPAGKIISINPVNLTWPVKSSGQPKRRKLAQSEPKRRTSERLKSGIPDALDPGNGVKQQPAITATAPAAMVESSSTRRSRGRPRKTKVSTAPTDNKAQEEEEEFADQRSIRLSGSQAGTAEDAQEVDEVAAPIPSNTVSQPPRKRGRPPKIRPQERGSHGVTASQVEPIRQYEDYAPQEPSAETPQRSFVELENTDIADHDQVDMNMDDPKSRMPIASDAQSHLYHRAESAQESASQYDDGEANSVFEPEDDEHTIHALDQVQLDETQFRHDANLQAAFCAVNKIGWQREKGKEILRALPSVKTQGAREFLKFCTDTITFLGVGAETETDQTPNLSKDLKKMAIDIGLKAEGLSVLERGVVQDILVHILPKLIRLLYRVLELYHFEEVNDLSTEEIQTSMKIMRAIIHLGNKAVSVKTNSIKGPPVKLLGRRIKSNITDVYTKFRSRLLAVKRQQEMEESRAEQFERTQQEAEDLREMQRIQSTWNEWRKHWNALHSERMAVEFRGRSIIPSKKIKHLSTAPLENQSTPSIELDANGEPIERIQIFGTRNSQPPHQKELHPYQPWAPELSYVLLKGLRQYAGMSALESCA